MKLNLKEIESVIKLSNIQRYKYMMKRIADQSCMWSLYESGWSIMGDNNEGKFFPIWPNREYAKLYANGDWSEYEPKKLSVKDFFDKWSDGLKKDGIKIAGFPVIGGIDLVVSIEDFVGNLEYERAQIW